MDEKKTYKVVVEQVWKIDAASVTECGRKLEEVLGYSRYGCNLVEENIDIVGIIKPIKGVDIGGAIC